MKRIVLFLLVLTSIRNDCLEAQKVLTLKECYDRANELNALADEKANYSKIRELKDKNLLIGRLPTLDANGSFIYNSSVIDMRNALGGLPIPGIADAIEPLPHEQYKLTVDINQVIYDGGAIKSARALEKADLKINEKQTEIDLYKLRSQINSYYFNIILLERQKELLNNYFLLIDRKISSLNSALDNGVIIKSDIDVLTSEKIKIRQQLSENEFRKAAFLKILAGLTGISFNDSTEFTLPKTSPDLIGELSRPELNLFDLKKEQLNASLQLIESKRMPKAFGFATFGYGNPPGNNFFKNEFAPYYILGAGVKWNIFDWNKAKNEKQVISFQQNIIDDRKSDLKEGFIRLLETKSSEISSLKSLNDSDSELIVIRKRITASAESQFQNGTITMTEYLNELNSEKQAVINSEIHKINLSMAMVEYLNLSGKEIE